MFGKALETIEQTVRSNDRVCPYGVSRIAIAFGPDVQAVAPRLLGERLARAIGQGLVGDRPSSPTASLRVNGARPGGQAKPSAPQPSAVSCHNRTIPCTTLITVDRSVEVAPKPLPAPGHHPGHWQRLDRLATTLAPPHRHPLLHPPYPLRNPPGRPPPPA